MTQFVWILSILICLTACKQSDIYSFDAPIEPSDSTTLYFPLKANSRYLFDKRELALDTVLNVRYCKALYTFKEPSLSSYSGGKNIFRFTYLRSFDDPIVIRMMGEIERKIVLSKILYHNHSSVSELRQNQRIISEKQWKRFTSSLDEAEFWELDPMTNPKSWHMDGAVWIMEAVKNGKYRFVIRQTPSEKFRKACEHLLQFSDIKLEKSEIY